jgi:hypothetical protein
MRVVDTRVHDRDDYRRRPAGRVPRLLGAYAPGTPLLPPEDVIRDRVGRLQDDFRLDVLDRG